MADDVSSRLLLAATLAEQAAADLKLPPDTAEMVWEPLTQAEIRQQFLDDGYEPEDSRVLAASGPSHWGAVAEMLRAAVGIHYDGGDRFCTVCERDGYPESDTCPSVAALLPLVDQIIRDLGEGQNG